MNRKNCKSLCLSILSVGILLLNSCTAYKKLPYLTNIDSTNQAHLLADQGVFEAKIKPNDILSITVNSTIAGAAADFNLPVVPQNYNQVVQTTVMGSNLGATSGSIQNYLVDKNGNIDFPVLGKLKIAGKNTRELQEYLTGEIYPRYISTKPVVNVRILNFKVSVLGEVNKPGTYTSDNGQMTLFDALAAAGDLTIYGRRNNVLLMRTTETGDVVTYRINLQDKNSVANKDIFYLQQNDKLYVETNKSKGNNSSIGGIESLTLSALSILISVISIITR